jgi:hypothetical protein
VIEGYFEKPENKRFASFLHKEMVRYFNRYFKAIFKKVRDVIDDVKLKTEDIKKSTTKAEMFEKGKISG